MSYLKIKCLWFLKKIYMIGSRILAFCYTFWFRNTINILQSGVSHQNWNCSFSGLLKGGFAEFAFVLIWCVVSDLSSGPQPFWHQGQVSWRTIFKQTREWWMVSGWFKCITFIVHFISVIIISAPPQGIRHGWPGGWGPLDPGGWGPHGSWRLGTPALENSPYSRNNSSLAGHDLSMTDCLFEENVVNL